MLAKVRGGHLVDFEQRFPQPAVGMPFLGFALFRKRHAEFLGERSYGILESELLMKLEELEHVAANVAAKAMKKSLLWVHVKRGRFFGVERTKPLVGLASTFERNVVLHDLQDVGLQAKVVEEPLRKEHGPGLPHSLSSTRVTPPPPCSGGAVSTRATSGCCCRKPVSARFS